MCKAWMYMKSRTWPSKVTASRIRRGDITTYMIQYAWTKRKRKYNLLLLNEEILFHFIPANASHFLELIGIKFFKFFSRYWIGERKTFSIQNILCWNVINVVWKPLRTSYSHWCPNVLTSPQHKKTLQQLRKEMETIKREWSFLFKHFILHM